jgi:type IV pilus assembly protein PilV
MPHAANPRSAQRGTTLVEAMVSVVVLGVGVLGLVALSTRLIQENVASRHRVQASFLAEQLIGLATADPQNGGCYAVNADDAVCASAAAEDAAAIWLERAGGSLPGQDEHPPLAEFDPADGNFAVTLQWRKASDAEVHRYVATTNVLD